MSGTHQSVTDIPCECGTLERLARDARYPIVFDALTGEYQLDSTDGRWRHQLYHCPWCGGCLPSKRDSLFTEPDATELAEVKQLLSGAKTLTDALEALGRPDQSIGCHDMDIPDAYASDDSSEKRQRSAHQYTTRWRTLDLQLIEYDDDSIAYGISGKFKGLPPGQVRKRNWWPPWRRDRPPT